MSNSLMYLGKAEFFGLLWLWRSWGAAKPPETDDQMGPSNPLALKSSAQQTPDKTADMYDFILDKIGKSEIWRGGNFYVKYYETNSPKAL